MVETTKKQWYVLHTYSGYEDKVKSDLLSRAQSMGMQDYIFRVMVPEQEKIEKVNNKKKEVEEKIFPGYVLVEMVMTDESWFVVRNTPNVTGFVGSHGGGSKPSPLLEEEVNRLLRQQGEGKITEIQPDKYKLFVSVDMFGRATTTELDYDQVKKIS